MGDQNLPFGWRGNWSTLPVLVIGCDEVGFAVADTLQELGCRVVVVSATPEGDREKILSVLGVGVVGDGGTHLTLPEGFAPTLVVAGEGSSRRHPLAVDAERNGATVWSEVELTCRLTDKSGRPSQIVFVAGAEGAVEVAQLATDLLVSAGRRALLVGRHGVVALDALRDPDPWEVLIWPVRSEELHDLANDHYSRRAPSFAVALDQEQSLDDSALAELYRGTRLACVYSRGGGRTERAVEEAEVTEGCRAIGVGLDSPGMSDLGVVEDIVCDRAFLDDRRHRALELTTLGELGRAGVTTPEGVLRAMAALTIARGFDVSPELIGEAIARWTAT